MAASDTLIERARQLMPGGVNSPVRAFRSVGGTPFFTQKAHGSHLVTVDGDTLIDYVCTWGPAIHGHNDSDIRHAIAEALNAGTSFGTPGPAEVEMATRLVELVPSVERVRMCNSGTEATMSAIRLARGFTGRDKIIKFSGCYHGHVDGLLVAAGSGALTLGNPDSAGVPEAYARETLVLEYNDAEGLEAALQAHSGTIAAVIIEPYPANTGLILPGEGYLQRLRALCTQHGVVLIFDEVMTGFRLAPGGVQELTGVVPDITAMGKIIGGGLPVGALGGKAEIMRYLAPEGPVYQAGTLSGNPLAMAAGLASLKKLSEQRDTLYPALQAKGARLAKALKDAALAKGLPLQIPQMGSMFAMFFSELPITNGREATTTNTDHFKQVFHYALKHGVYLPPSAYETCFISTAHTEADVDKTCEVLTQAIATI